MTIRDTLLPELKRRFPNRGMRLGVGDVIASFPAHHPEVGDVEIRDDGDEATLTIGLISHQHFNPYDQDIEPAIAERLITQEVVDFLEELFADRVLLWKSTKDFSGGWGPVDADFRDFPEPESNLYLWSGPLRKWPKTAPSN